MYTITPVIIKLIGSSYRGERRAQVALVLRLEFSGVDEAVGHSLEILARNRSVLVEVDALEVRCHFAEPEIRHDCS